MADLTDPEFLREYVTESSIILDPAVVLTEDEVTVLTDHGTWDAAEKAARSTEKRPRRRA